MCDKLHLYVDGSWKLHKPNVSGWAFLVLDWKEDVIYKDSGIVFCKSRQIDGELTATIEALKYIFESNIQGEEIIIYYDYIGIEKWARGLWKAKSEVAIEYVNNLKIYEKFLHKVTFVKIKSHSGLSVWNDSVDKMAKDEVDNYRTCNTEKCKK